MTSDLHRICDLLTQRLGHFILQYSCVQSDMLKKKKNLKNSALQKMMLCIK